MTASVYRLVTLGSTNLNQVSNAPAKVKGIIAVNTAAYAIFVKLYWFLPTASASGPTVGTTPVSVTIEIPALATSGGGIAYSFTEGFMHLSGNLFIAVTKLAAESDTTAVIAGDGLISLLVDPA
jgi:hypothetical protein